MSTLILYLPETLPPVGEASPTLQHLVAEGDQATTTVATSALDLLSVQHGAEVVAIVPIGRLSWQRVQLPRGTLNRKGGADPARLRSVLSGALEELLLDEPEALHFALEPRAQDGVQCTVAVCDRVWLQTWLQALEAHGFVPARIVPEESPAGAGSEESSTTALQIFARGEQAWVVWPAQEGVLALLPFEVPSIELMRWPMESPVLAEPSVAAQAERLLQRRVGLQSQADRWLAAARGSWDLAQLEWANAHAHRNWRRVGVWVQGLWRAPRWRVARWAALVVVVVNLAGLNAWAWAQRGSLKAKQGQVASILQQSFPEVKVVIDAPVQMRKGLKLRRQNSGQSGVGDVETLLTAAAGVGQAQPTAIEYVDGELRLSGWLLTDAERFSAQLRLAAQGVDMRQEGGVVVLRGKEGP